MTVKRQFMYKLPFINSSFSQPTAAAALTIVPKFPGSLILSQITVRGIASLAGCFATTSGISKTPVSKNNYIHFFKSYILSERSCKIQMFTKYSRRSC